MFATAHTKISQLIASSTAEMTMLRSVCGSRSAAPTSGMLNAKQQAGEFDRLVIAAAPAALGDIRPALSDEVKETILAEMPKDLTNIPIPKLAEHFDGLLAV